MNLPADMTHLTLDGFPDHPMADLLAELPVALTFIDAAVRSRHGRDSTDKRGAPTTVTLSPLAVTSSHDRDSRGHRGGALLVHCASGVSRSVGVCCAWLMTRQSLSYDEALALIRVNRPNANPNVGFRTQLLALQDSQGDISHAKQLHLERFGDVSVTDILRTQRQEACAFHEEVDIIEEEIKANESVWRAARHAACEEASLAAAALVGVIVLAGWRRRLEEMLETIEMSAAAGVHVHLDDKPASSIRKSATSKVTRLLRDLDDLQDTGLN